MQADIVLLQVTMALTGQDTDLLETLQQLLVTKNQKISELESQPLRLYDYCWGSTQPAPDDLLRSVDAVVDDDGRIVYLRKGKSKPSVIHSYDVLNQTWLPPFNCGHDVYFRFSMVYHTQVLMIGGTKIDESQCGNEIFGLNPPNIFSRMPSRRCRATSLKWHHEGKAFLIVIGGEDVSNSTLKTVEILNLAEEGNYWQRAQDIPEPLSCTSGTIVNGVIYILGGWSKRDHQFSSAYRCNVQDLIATTIPGNNMGEVWGKLPDLPVEEAACTSFKDQVMVVGGKANKIAVRDIRTYNEVQKRWDVIGYLPTPRYNCFAVGLLDKLIVIGGKKDSVSNENTIDIYQDK